MPACLTARTAIVKLMREGEAARAVLVAFPSGWTRAQFMAYVRQEHPSERVKLVEWHTVANKRGGRVKLWVVNPLAFKDFKRGVLK